ncbi:MAG: hypothetical protein AAGK00_04735 [Pseudomonadota bacterium]
MRLVNSGGPDQLIDANASNAQLTILKARTGAGLPVPARSTSALTLEAGHIAVMGLVEAPAEGSELPLSLDFTRSGPVEVSARFTVPSSDERSRLVEMVTGSQPWEPVLTAIADDTGWLITSEFGLAERIAELADGPDLARARVGIYVDGMKIIQRVSDPARIGRLLRGRYMAQAMLLTADEQPFVINGEPISAEIPLVAD